MADVGSARPRRRVSVLLAAACVLTLLASAGVWVVEHVGTGTAITAYFGKSIGVYPGSSVRVLGIAVGKVTAVQPQGDVVKVDMSVDHGIRIPANARAVIVASSLVSDRYVQLTPAYKSGAEMASGTVIPHERTATPVEVDGLYDSASKLAQALGPNGANKNGALNDVLKTGAANLAGNGQNLHDTVEQLDQAAAALSGSQDDLFTTVDNLQKFTTMLAASDNQVQEFEGKLANVTGFLADDRKNVGAALDSLAVALPQVQGFIQDNQGRLKSNVDNLAAVTKVLVDQRAALNEIMDVAPTGLTDYINSYDASANAIDVRGDLNELTFAPIMTACRLVKAGTPMQVPDTLAKICQQLAPVLDGALKLPSPAQLLANLSQGKPPALPLPLLNAVNAQNRAMAGLPLPGVVPGGGR